ncbi:MAG: DUF308 domain-containing protein [Muribaculaceae bacterium]|nr:DUF308 domain-containing protein [Muribaculaceae bacterium]
MTKQGFNYLGSSRLWWLLIILGVLLVIGGFAYWLWPVAGYAVASVIFGWMLVATGVVQLCVTASNDRPRGWGWWLAGGIINTFVGFMLVTNIFLAEAVLPYFLAFVFFYAGLLALSHAFGRKGHGIWWLSLINGILLIILGGIFCGGSYYQEMTLVTFLAALAFIYWGFTLCTLGYDLKPRSIER